MLQLVQQIALFAGTLIGGATDAKTGYIYDWITYPMIVVGLILSVIQWQLFNLALGAGIFIVMLVAYKLGKIGGGDVKIFTGIALLNPYNNLSFLAAIVLFAAISAMLFYSVFYSLKYFRAGGTINKIKDDAIKSLLLGAALAFYFYTILNMGIIREEFIIVLGVPFAFGLLFLALQKGIKEMFFEKKVLLKNIEEDEVIVPEKCSAKALKVLKGKVLIGEKEVVALRKAGVKDVIALRDLPKFGPFIFFGTLMALIFPTFFELLLMV